MLQPTFPATKPEGLDPITSEFFDYYVQDQGRGWHPRSIGSFTLSSFGSHINVGSLANIEDIAPRPILLITGDIAHSRYLSEDVHAKSGGRAELVVVPGARHVDLYDRTDLIPFDRLESFFADKLR